MTDIILVHVLLIKRNQVLLGLRTNTAYGNGMYALPGGRREPYESPTEAISREAKEELGLQLDQKTLKFELTSYYRDDGRSFLNLFFSCDQWTGTVSNQEEEKCSHLKWFDVSELPQNTIYFIKDAISGICRGDRYREIKDGS